MSSGVYERVLENWLDRSVETSYQYPFSYMLINKGYDIVHITRHWSMELGKDILAIAPDGVPCAFQLKTTDGPRMTMSQWDPLQPQLLKLVTYQFKHPSLGEVKERRTYLVTNGALEEDVVRAIYDFNESFAAHSLPYKLHVIQRHDLLAMARSLREGLWPSELSEVHLTLELFLAAGQDFFPKEKFSELLRQILITSVEAVHDKRKKKHTLRAVASAALVTSIVLTNFLQANNHFAVAEAWTMYLAYAYAACDRAGISKTAFQNEEFVAKQFIWNAVGSICEELNNGRPLQSSDPFFDKPFMPARITLLKALVSVYALKRRSLSETDRQLDNFERQFCQDESIPLHLWGEGAIPQFLALFWHKRRLDVSPRAEFFLYSLIKYISRSNALGSNLPAIPPPYESLSSVLEQSIGLADSDEEPVGHGASYTIEGLTHLFTRRLWRQATSLLWPEITKLSFAHAEHDSRWKQYLWLNTDSIHVNKHPPLTKRWPDLLSESHESSGEGVPSFFKDDPLIYLMFLIVFPHRINASGMRWLDTEIKAIP